MSFSPTSYVTLLQLRCFYGRAINFHYQIYSYTINKAIFWFTLMYRCDRPTCHFLSNINSPVMKCLPQTSTGQIPQFHPLCGWSHRFLLVLSWRKGIHSAAAFRHVATSFCNLAPALLENAYFNPWKGREHDVRLLCNSSYQLMLLYYQCFHPSAILFICIQDARFLYRWDKDEIPFVLCCCYLSVQSFRHNLTSRLLSVVDGLCPPVPYRNLLGIT